MPPIEMHRIDTMDTDPARAAVRGRRSTAAVWKLLTCLMILSAGTAHPASGQEYDTLHVRLPEITVDAVRETETAASAPYALNLEIREPEEVAFEPALALDGVLRSVPGVWVNDRAHFALGERISVRGMGARAPFGVRGVQVLLDGIPLTMPDGQAVLEIVEPSVLRRIEVLRSPASLFWGNGSGGVFFLSSGAPPVAPSFRVRALTGAYGQRHLLLEGAAPIGRHDVQVWASDLTQDGYRDYSEGRRSRAGAIARFDLGPRTQLRTVGAGVYQDAENPSALTREQVEDDPRAAREENITTGSGKKSWQAQIGSMIEHRADLGTLTASVYGLHRDLENPLPYAFVDVDRMAGGFRAALRREEGRIQWGIGADGGIQHDIRKNFNNDRGQAGDMLELDQIEDVSSAGAFAYGRIELRPDLHATAGLRYSRIHFMMDDRLLQNGDESGSRLFSAWSPSLGLSYRYRGALLFANYGTAFETPTTTELVNRPDMTGGFNPDLDPQITRGVEVGMRGALGPRIFVDAVLFYLDVEGRLLSFENELGREYFRNTGENTHKGVELAAEWLPAASYSVEVSYTGSRYVFREDELKGNLMPGVPEHRFFAALQANRGGLWGRLEGEAVSEYFVDDLNTAVNDAYLVFDLSLGHEGVAVGPGRVRPFATVKNIFDVQYNASVVVNAFGGRYYEPAPGRAVLAGLEFSF